MRLWNDAIDANREEARALLEFLPSIEGLDESQHAGPLERAQAVRQAISTLVAQATPSTMAVDSTIAGPGGELPVRLHMPDTPRGMLLHIHGGGWVAGDPTMADIQNDQMATAHGLAVVSVDYRLAPEHPYPAAPDDCEAAALWMLAHGPSEWGADRLLLAGESAGAHLAAVTMLRLRDRHDAIDRVLGANLVFGCYDLRGTPSTFGNGGRPDLLSAEGLLFTAESFVGGLDEAGRRDPDVSPLFADLRGLPPCLLSVGTYDHLLDDSLFFAARLAAADSPVELAVYPDSPHGYTALPTKMADAHNERVDAWISALLS